MLYTRISYIFLSVRLSVHLFVFDLPHIQIVSLPIFLLVCLSVSLSVNNFARVGILSLLYEKEEKNLHTWYIFKFQQIFSDKV